MAKGDILLHKEKGLNPRLTYCVRCGGKGRDLILVGARDKVITCPSCGINAIGFTHSQRCPSCKEKLTGGKSRILEDNERLPGGLCQVCEDEVKAMEAEIKSGGVYVKCKCGMQGIIKADHPLAKNVRDHFNLHNGEPCGTEIETCPKCEKR
jgi:hypothetical protein